MGLWKRLADDAEETRRRAARRRRQRGRGRGVHVEITRSETTQAALLKFPIELRKKVLTKAVRASGAPVRSAARSHLKRHRSKDTGTRDKWSNKTKQARSYRKQDLYQSIAIKVKTYGSKVVAIIGARRPDGAHAHLLEYGGRRIMWGGNEYTAEPQPFLRPAADETKPQQRAAMIRKISKEWDKL